MNTLRTEHLLIRPFREEDREPFIRMNTDPRVMEFFPKVPTREEIDQLMNEVLKPMKTPNIGWRAVELLEASSFIGMVALAIPRFEAWFTPCVEIGWRLDPSAWGKGYAVEAARALIAEALGSLGMKELVSFTAEVNLRSRRVMEKLGMERDQDFDHPLLPEGHPLRRHVLYRMRRPS